LARNILVGIISFKNAKFGIENRHSEEIYGRD